MNTDKQCKHIAIIMDGNGRWAKKRAMPRTFGHQKGAETVIRIIKGLKNTGVKYLTLYAFSTENWNRTTEEVSTLMQLLENYLDKDLKEIMKNNIRIMFIGERYMLSDSICKKMGNIEHESKNNSDFVLCIALSYGGRSEIVAATKKIAKEVINGKINIEDINQNLVSESLYTNGIPDPDILIRTSGEQRISGFLLWQLAYTEMFFTKTLWPDFSVEELLDIIEKFNHRERRYGKN